MEVDGDEAFSRWLSSERVAALDQLFERAPDTVGIMDRELRLRYISKVAEGLTREALLGQTAALLVPPDQQEAVHATFARVLATGVSDGFETTFMDLRGLRIWEVRVGPIEVEGSIMGLTFITCDVTDRREVSADRDRFFALSQDMLVVVNREGLLTRVNPAFTKTLGYEPTEVVGRRFSDLLHPEDRERTNRNFVVVKAGTPATDFENRYLRKDGAACVFSWRSIVDPLTLDVYAVGRDVTEQRRIESRLRHAQKMEAVGQLAGGVAHDFNNLLLATLSNVELARMQSPSEAVADHLLEIERASQRAADLTKQLLAFSRQQSLRPTIVSLNDLLGGLMKLLRRLLPESITIVTSLAPELASVSGDPSQLEQVIVNLCVNARDAMASGGQLTIRTSNSVVDARHCEAHPWATPGAYVRLSVTDSGTGMTREVRERAFEPFFTTKEMRGTGLGLATVYGVVQQHGGVIELRSAPGEGTTFEIYLPATAGAPSKAPPTPAPAAARGHETILIAEDEELVRRAYVRGLQRAGYRTIAACDGAEAVRLASEGGEIHLAILDLVMPRLGGVEAYEQLKRLRPGLRFIFASGYADPEYRARLPKDAAVLNKPFGIDEVLQRVRAKLDDGL